MEVLKVLKKLKPYLNKLQYDRLIITTSYTISNVSKLVVTQTVSDICKEYESTEENEEKVGGLLVELLRVVLK